MSFTDKVKDKFKDKSPKRQKRYREYRYPQCPNRYDEIRPDRGVFHGHGGLRQEPPPKDLEASLKGASGGEGSLLGRCRLITHGSRACLFDGYSEKECPIAKTKTKTCKVHGKTSGRRYCPMCGRRLR